MGSPQPAQWPPTPFPRGVVDGYDAAAVMAAAAAEVEEEATAKRARLAAEPGHGAHRRSHRARRRGVLAARVTTTTTTTTTHHSRRGDDGGLPAGSGRSAGGGSGGGQHVNAITRMDMDSLRTDSPSQFEKLDTLQALVTEGAAYLLSLPAVEASETREDGGSSSAGAGDGQRRKFPWQVLRTVFEQEITQMAAALAVPPDRVEHWVMARVRNNIRVSNWRRVGSRGPPPTSGRGQTPTLSYGYLGQLARAFVETYFGGSGVSGGGGREFDRSERKSVRRTALSLLEHAGSVFTNMLFILCEVIHGQMCVRAVSAGEPPPAHPTSDDLAALFARFGSRMLGDGGGGGGGGGGNEGPPLPASTAAGAAAVAGVLPAAAHLIGMLRDQECLPACRPPATTAAVAVASGRVVGQGGLGAAALEDVEAETALTPPPLSLSDAVCDDFLADSPPPA